MVNLRFQPLHIAFSLNIDAKHVIDASYNLSCSCFDADKDDWRAETQRGNVRFVARVELAYQVLGYRYHSWIVRVCIFGTTAHMHVWISAKPQRAELQLGINMDNITYTDADGKYVFTQWLPLV